MIGSDLITKQTGEQGRPCEKVFVVERRYPRRKSELIWFLIKKNYRWILLRDYHGARSHQIRPSFGWFRFRWHEHRGGRRHQPRTYHQGKKKPLFRFASDFNSRNTLILKLDSRWSSANDWRPRWASPLTRRTKLRTTSWRCTSSSRRRYLQNKLLRTPQKSPFF